MNQPPIFCFQVWFWDETATLVNATDRAAAREQAQARYPQSKVLRVEQLPRTTHHTEEPK